MMLLSTEEFLLFLLDEQNGALLPITPRTESLALAGAVLMDLQLADRIDTDLDNLTLSDPRPLDDDVLDPTLAEIVAADEKHNALYWLERTAERAQEIRERTIARLVSRGILQDPEDDELLELTPEVAHARRYPPTDDGKTPEHIKLRIMRVLFTDEIPDPTDIIIISLVDACDVWRKVLSAEELTKARKRIAIVARLDLIGQAVARLVRIVSPTTRDASVASRPVPQIPGIPLFGNTFAVGRSQRTFYRENYLKYGPVYRVKLATRSYITMAGQEANQFVARSERSYLHTADMWDPLVHQVGADRFVLNTNGQDHVRMRREMKNGFSRTLIEKQIPETIEVVQRHIARLPRNEALPGLITVQRLVGETAGFLGAHASTVDYVEDVLVLMRGMLKRGVFRMPWLFQTPRLRRAARRVVELADTLLRDHQLSQRGRPADVVDDMIELHRADPMFLPETDLPLAALLPLFAGIDTAAAVGSCMLYKVMKDPELREQVQAESDALFAGGAPDVEKAKQLDATHRLMLETMRLYTPGPGQMRKVTTSFDFAGYHIPAGEYMTIAASVTHDLPEHFPEPEKFDIDRYLPGREEHKKPGVYAPFGLGVHHCAGRALAEMQLPVILATLLHEANPVLTPKSYNLRVKEVPFLAPDKRLRFQLTDRAN